MWEFLRLPPPTPVQLDIARNLQHAPRRFILQAFRGVGKSWVTAAFVAWNLLLDPQLKVMIVSANQQLADDQSKFIKQIIHGMPMLHHLAPREGQKDSSIKFDVGPATESKDPSVKSVGINGQLTGSRADIIVADDVEIPKNSLSAILRERLANDVKEFESLIKPHTNDLGEITSPSRVIFLGTPQIESSLYNRLSKERGYTIRIWPAEIPGSTEKYNGRLAPYVLHLMEKGARAGSPVDSKRFTAEDLAERKLSYGSAGYALQFMLDTSPSDAEKHPLKLSDLILMDTDPEMAPVRVVWGRDRERWVQDLEAGGMDGDGYYAAVWRSPEMAKYQGVVMAVDPSGRGGDETGYAIVAFSHGQCYWLASGGFRDGFGVETLKALAAQCVKHRVTTVITEQNYGGGMFDQLLIPHLQRAAQAANLRNPQGQAWCPEVNPEDYDGWSKGQKELRILDILEPVFKSHRLVVDKRVIEEDWKQQQAPNDGWRYSAVYQMTRMCREKGALKNEDRLEALAMAVAFWTDRMDRDQRAALMAHREEQRDEMLARFMDGFSDFGQGSGRSGGYRFAGRRIPT